MSLSDMLVNEFSVFFCVSSVFVAALWGFEVDVAILSVWNFYCGVNLNGLEYLFEYNAHGLCAHA